MDDHVLPTPTPCDAGHRAGFVSLAGRSNVGKSTLLNQIVGVKLAAVADKPQTTRNRIVGILTQPHAQIVFVDLPGIHVGRALLNTRMVAIARQAIGEADVALLVVDATAGVTADDVAVAGELPGGRPRVVAITKTDRTARPALLAVCARAADLFPGAEIVPVSGLTGDNVTRLVDVLTRTLPPGPTLYPDDQVTEQSERFLVSEVIREKVIAQTRDELPYTTAVVVSGFQEEPARILLVIEAAILVERTSQRGIVIGEHGRRVRDIGSAARRDLEAIFGCRVYLDLHVRVQADWSKDPRVLRDLGL